MALTQKYGIKFPITVESQYNTLFDLNYTKSDRVRSDIMHVIFTQKGQRLRNPDFGTNLLQFIFNPNDLQTWGDVKQEIKDAVKRYVPDGNLEDIEIFDADDGRTLVAALRYTVIEDNGTVSESVITTTL